MKCPRCVQKIHKKASRCPHCEFFMKDADILFGREDRPLSKMNDVAGVLRYQERKQVRHLLDEFERCFPQLFFAVYYGAEEEVRCIRQFGFWLLNRADFKDLKQIKNNQAGILLAINVSSKTAHLSYGYCLEPYLSEKITFDALARAHPHFLQGEYQQATETIVRYVTQVLRKASKREKKTSKKTHKELIKKEIENSVKEDEECLTPDEKKQESAPLTSPLRGETAA